MQEEEYIQEQNKNGLFVSSTTSATVQSVPISSMSCSATIDKTKEPQVVRPKSRQLGNSRPVSRQRVASRYVTYSILLRIFKKQSCSRIL